MKHTQSICTLALALSMAAALCAPALAVQEEETWTRSEAGGKYVTVRLSYPDGPGLSYLQEQALAARYADTGEPIALTSVLYDTALFVTVPAENAGRPIEIYQAAPARFDDCANEYTLPLGTQVLNARGIVRGTGKGNLSPSSALTRAEAFTLIVRLLDLPVPGDENWQGVGNKTWFSDVSPDAWYYDTAAAALAAGIAAEGETFDPNRPVTRAEFTAVAASLCVCAGAANAATGGALADSIAYCIGEMLPVNAYKMVAEDEEGSAVVVLGTDVDVAEKDGRVLLTVGGETVDITDGLAADGTYTYEDTDGGTTVRVTVYPDEDHPGEWAYTLTIDDPAILEDGGETTITSYGSTADGSVSGGDVTANFWEPQENAE